jgi:hypothetical protein
LLNVDKQRARTSQITAVANTKIVTLHNRMLNRFPTVTGYTGGYYWFSIDTDSGVDKEDYLNNLATFDTPVFKAKELIGTLPNTLQAYAVVDTKGTLINAANPNIAIHGDTFPSRLQDKQVYAGLRSCAICHYGIQPIRCEVRARAQGDVGLTQLFRGRISDIRTQEKLVEAFGPDLNGVIAHDNAIYANAVKAVNGLDARVNSAQFEDFLYEYLEQPVTLTVAARESGYTEEQLEAAIRATVGADYTLIGLVQKPTPVPASRLNWERRGFIQLMLLMSSVPPQR